MSEPNEWQALAEVGTGWDHETGAPSPDHLANAIQVWSVLQGRKTSVAEAARAFNVAPRHVIEVIDREYGWMSLIGPRDDLKNLIIEHEGE